MGDSIKVIPNNIPEGYNPVEQEWYKLAIKVKEKSFGQNLILDYVTQEIIITASKSVE